MAESPGAQAQRRDLPYPQPMRIAACACYIVLATLLFIQPLMRLVLYAVRSDLNSHIVLVPFISGYLLYIRRGRLATAYRRSFAAVFVAGGIGIATLTMGLEWRRGLSDNDDLALMAIAYVSFLAAGLFLFLGSKWMRSAAFPIAFLIFMVPLSDAAVNWLVRASVRGSSDAAAMFFDVVGTPLVRQGTMFELPGITLQIAPECSGIHSSWVLLLTGLIASHLFLRDWWRKTALVAFVIPLGILRNGFRILVIGELCVHISPRMIDSPIHHRGGPIFFALALIPFFLVLWWLRKKERGNVPG